MQQLRYFNGTQQSVQKTAAASTPMQQVRYFNSTQQSVQ
jgi:hypothetical protein